MADKANEIKNEIALVDERSLRSKIYVIRGQKVMLESDLAELYGYDHKGFNKQVNNNSERFDEDFRFKLTREEVNDLRSNFYAANISPKSRTLPYVYTESGIYMLMAVLKGDLAVRQSKTLIRLFKSMKDYLIETPQLLAPQSYYALMDRVEENSRHIKAVEDDIKTNMVTRADLADFIRLFDQGTEAEEILILDGQPFKADEAYQKIYRKAKQSIIVIDDYIGVKTLHHLAHAKPSVQVTIISDNKARPQLKAAEYKDFLTENSKRSISFIQSAGRPHDRYIVLDEGADNMKVYHCGASSKDAGRKITTITRIMDIEDYKTTIKSLLQGAPLILK